MWILYSLLALLGLLTVLLSIPVFGQLTYNNELLAKVWILGIPVDVWPRTAEPSQDSKAAVRSGAKKKASKAKPSKLKELATLLKQDDLEGTLHFLHEVVSLTTTTIGRLLRSLTILSLDLDVLIALEDPADTAQRYGQVCSVLYPALSIIGHEIGIRQRNLRIEPNFLMEKSKVNFDIRVRMSMWRLLGAGIALLWGFLMIKEQSNPQTNKEVS